MYKDALMTDLSIKTIWKIRIFFVIKVGINTNYFKSLIFNSIQTSSIFCIVSQASVDYYIRWSLALPLHAIPLLEQNIPQEPRWDKGNGLCQELQIQISHDLPIITLSEYDRKSGNKTMFQIYNYFLFVAVKRLKT